jgi:hypothetical protein
MSEDTTGTGTGNAGDSSATTQGSDDFQKRLNAQDAAHKREMLKVQQDRDTLAAKLAEIDEAKKTEHEKALDQARKETRTAADKEWNDKLRTMEINHALDADLRSRGYDPDLAHAIRAKAAIDDPASVKASVDAFLTEKKWPAKLEIKTPAPGYPGSPAPATSGSTGRFTRSQLRDHDFYQKHEKEILQAQSQGLIDED